MKKMLYIVVAIAAVVGAFVLLGGDSSKSTAQPTNHVLGNNSSGVAVVEYADFQCPGCAAFQPIAKEVKEKYKDYISFQFIHFPLSQIHQNALAAHRAAQAASNQGKFWEMHDLLFENQTSWQGSTTAVKDFEAFAGQLGLDMEKYKKDYASSETNSIIQADIKTGQDKKVTGTPTFFIDGKQIEDNNSIATVDKFSKAIEDAIEAKTGKRPNVGATPATSEVDATAQPSTTTPSEQSAQ